MKFSPRTTLLLAALAAAALIPSLRGAAELPTAKAAKPADSDWKLVWSDDFNGTEIDKSKWDFESGNGFKTDNGQFVGGWGNNELEYYTDRPENTFVKDGALHIRAVKESYKNCQYTSARLRTRKTDKSALFNKAFGRFEFRAKLPTGKGVWPAIWLLPQDEKYGGWAASGEIDIMEARGQEPNKVLGTLHYGSKWPGNTHTGKDFIFPDKGTIADFHVYALEWEPGEIRWYVDDQLYQTQNFWWSNSGGAKPASETDLNPWPAPFDQPYYIILNVAVGGQFLGNPDKSTTFPVEMVVDYVRVYDKTGGYGTIKPRGDGKLPFGKR
jgi:beta-glucanase (GH16 family)